MRKQENKKMKKLFISKGQMRRAFVGDLAKVQCDDGEGSFEEKWRFVVIRGSEWRKGEWGVEHWEMLWISV